MNNVTSDAPRKTLSLKPDRAAPREAVEADADRAAEDDRKRDASRARTETVTARMGLEDDRQRDAKRAAAEQRAAKKAVKQDRQRDIARARVEAGYAAILTDAAKRAKAIKEKRKATKADTKDIAKTKRAENRAASPIESNMTPQERLQKRAADHLAYFAKRA